MRIKCLVQSVIFGIAATLFFTTSVLPAPTILRAVDRPPTVCDLCEIKRDGV